jgi:uncharacterized repeat protein (TIGR03806 family)
MRTGARRGLWPLALSLAALIGCGDDVGQTGGSGGAAGSGGGGGSAGADAGPDAVPAQFGLDQRPANPGCTAPARPTTNTQIMVSPAFSNLSFTNPIALEQAPGDSSRFFLAQKNGLVKRFANDANVSSAATFIDITARVNSGPNEAGLLGMAFHPNFAQNHQVFLSYTAYSSTSPANLKSTISRFVSNDGGATLDPASEQVLVAFDQPFENHNGGNILFGPDGFLYAGFGDGGSGGDPLGNGQNINVLFGKMLRINVDGGSPYSIPPDNPFASGGGRGEIYAWGLRNPWRWSFDRATGELWVGDVGQDRYEEVDHVQLGGNYGWNIREGFHCYNATTCNTAGLIDPIVEYDHSQGISITGGYVYRGAAIPPLVGTYLYGDYGSGTIWGLFYDPVTGRPAPQPLTQAGFNISSFGEGNDGELYVLRYGSSGAVYKVVAAGGSTGTFPQTLAATGCFDAADPTRPTSGLIPYGVNAPLWSDGASKERFLALPDGSQIHVGADGDFDLPIGSVLVKTFSLDGMRVETRLLVHHADGDWAGYSYEWNDAGTDATLLPASKTKAVGSHTWYFPSRAQCLECHTTAAGRTLGLELGQQNGDFVYPSTNRVANQLATLDHIGLFDAPLPGAPQTLPAYPAFDSSAPVSDRAKSYLHANCSICHRPGGIGGGPQDFRYATPLAMMNVCNVAPTRGDLGVSGAQLVAPGMPDHSIVWLRMNSLDAPRMPPLATHVLDTQGLGIIGDWIRQLTGCM